MNRSSLAQSAIASALIVALAVASSEALETDQHYAWGRTLADSTDVVNAKFNLELERAVASFPPGSPPSDCTEVVVAFRKRLRSLLQHPIMLWSMNSALVPRIPANSDEHRRYRRTNLYSNHPPIDPGSWMPYAPTIEIGGVRLGTDKLSHFVSSGWTYYATYRRALAKNGADEDEAVRAAVRRGIQEESFLLGGATAGSLAIADVEAAFQGLHLYSDLCDISDPILQLGAEGWVITRPIDLRSYVKPRWDESFQPPVYSRSRWRKVRPMLEGYCDRLDDPQVVEMLQRYRSQDRQTVVGEIVAELVAEGKLEDPARFGFDAVCTAADLRVTATAASPEPPLPATDDRSLTELIVEEEQSRRRRALGLFGAQLTNPQIFSVSLGVMATSQPTSYDCRTVCEFWGPFAQIEPGIGGGKLSAGWGRATGSTGKADRILTRVYLAAAVKATILRTWGKSGPVEVKPGQTFAGPELEFSIARMNFGLGLLHRLDDGKGSPWLITGGIGWGF